MENKVIYKCDCCGKETTNDQSFTLSISGDKIEVHRCDICDDRLDREFEWERDNCYEYCSNIICPYCDYEMDDYDSYSYVEYGSTDECECPKCGKSFKLEIKQIVEFSTYRRVEDMPEDYNNYYV